MSMLQGMTKSADFTQTHTHTQKNANNFMLFHKLLTGY